MALTFSIILVSLVSFLPLDASQMEGRGLLYCCHLHVLKSARPDVLKHNSVVFPSFSPIPLWCRVKPE